MGLKLYFDKMSQPSRALLMFVRANKGVIPCEEVPVALRKGTYITLYIFDHLRSLPFLCHAYYT